MLITKHLNVSSFVYVPIIDPPEPVNLALAPTERASATMQRPDSGQLGSGSSVAQLPISTVVGHLPLASERHIEHSIVLLVGVCDWFAEDYRCWKLKPLGLVCRADGDARGARRGKA